MNLPVQRAANRPSPVARRPIHRSAEPRHGGALGALIVCLVAAGVIGAISYTLFFSKSDEVDLSELITQTVVKAPFDHIVLEQGEIESSSNIEVTCQVKSTTGGGGGVSILWVIDEGTPVQEGDKLVELDSSQLEQTLNDDKIRVIAAEANVTTAKAAVEQAIIAREEYIMGVFMTDERAIMNEKLVAEQELIKAQKALESSQRLVAKGLIKSLQLDADKFALAKCRNDLEAADGRLTVLRDLTKKKMLVQFDSDIDSARAQLSAFESELEQEMTSMAETEEQIKNCIMYAPAAGVVVHANKYSSRGGNAEFVVEAGASVRERQEIIRLPDPSKMQVECKINESRITLISQGMAVKINVDAIPGLQLKGIVSKVNNYAVPGGMMSGSIKEYAVLIDILDPPEVIRTGMTAEVQIFVEQLDDAIQMPIQGLYEHDNKMLALIRTGPKTFETRKVKIGATNDTMATIEEGLDENDTVVLNLRDHLNLMDLPEMESTDNSDMRAIANVDPNAKRGGPPGGGKGGRGGGGPRGGGRSGGGGPNGGGRSGGGGFGGGGAPDPGAIVTMMMDRSDTDKDGMISAEEVQSIDSSFRDRITAADTDGDGAITRAELMSMIKKRMGT